MVTDEPDRVTRARKPATRAKARELAADRRAEELHEEAAKMQRAGHGDRAQAARELHADALRQQAEADARELHADALRQQAEADERAAGEDGR